MSDKKKVFNKISKFIGAFSRKGIELPRYITSEEMSAIIKKGSKSTNNIKRFRNIENSTPSPSHDKHLNLEKSPEPSFKSEELNSRNIKTRESQQISQKVLSLKLKNKNLKDSIKEIQVKHQSQLLSLKRENEKLIQSIKSIKKEHLNEKIKSEELISILKAELKTVRDDFNGFVQQIFRIIENKSFCFEAAKTEFNKTLNPVLTRLPGAKSFLFPDQQEFISTGGFAVCDGFSDSMQSIKLSTEAEAIVLKNYKAQAHGELDLKMGDRVVIMKSDDDYMWLGRLNEKIGLFPNSHVMLD